ncbi:unnamed protein product [Parnassius mnemosyne]|uniref:RING-type domain-containing protein n=1 Tax=Parnassius mnemosyne TaxID=213953 RepID=A0AAV1LW60_9NEOP
MTEQVNAYMVWGCCVGELENENYFSSISCNKAFHHACTNCEAALRNSTNWTCPTCSGKSPKPPRDDNAPVRFNSNVTVRGARRQALSSLPTTSCNSLNTDDVRDIVQDVIQNELSTLLTKLNVTITALVGEEL